MKLGHVAVSVANIARSAAFYKKHFDLRAGEKYIFKDKGMTIVLLKKGGITLELFEFKKRKALPQYRKTLDSDLRTLGVKHFSLETRDISAAFRKFRKAGCLATDLRAFASGKRYFFVRDPDGNLVELMEVQR